MSILKYYPVVRLTNLRKTAKRLRFRLVIFGGRYFMTHQLLDFIASNNIVIVG
jgi:hypothetical protein